MEDGCMYGWREIRKRFSPHTVDVARECGVSKHMVHAWKAKYGGMKISEVEELKRLQEENTPLKEADLSLDKDMLQWDATGNKRRARFKQNNHHIHKKNDLFACQR